MFHGFSMSCPVALNSIMQDCMISVQSEHAFRKHLGLSPLIFICRFGSANQSAVVSFFVCIHTVSVGHTFKGNAYKFCVLSAGGLVEPTRLCARWFECISHCIAGLQDLTWSSLSISVRLSSV